VRFRQQSLVHDFVRDSLRTALIKARPAAGFLAALDSAAHGQPVADAPGRVAAALPVNRLGSLKPLGQLRESFILAAGDDGLWIIDQHVAHERVLFEKILRDRQVENVQRQRLLMPLLVELKPEQMVVFARIAEELETNGFEVEPFGLKTLAVKAAPVGLEGAELERTLGRSHRAIRRRLRRTRSE
jgi:DNA mismatch repair protein MutL